MAKFPIERTDEEGIVDALNYVLSGPGGLGQNFKGVSFSAAGYLTGNSAPAFTSPTPVFTYIAPISVSTAVKLDSTTFKYTFTAAEPTPPFFLGSNLVATGMSIAQYNRRFTLGVVECTTTYVIARVRRPLGDPGSATGGTVGLELLNGLDDYHTTDCDIRDIIVTSATDRVFVSSQLLNSIYCDSTVTSNLVYTVALNRYRASTTNDLNNLNFTYSFDETVAYRTYNSITCAVGTQVLVADQIDTLFTNVVDSPGPGLFRYRLELQFFTDFGGDAIVSYCEFGYRSLACQVVKE
jgi:hypothetical protein